MNYYNDNDPNSAATLRELIRRGLISNGIVDDRSILDVEPSDLRGFTQCHFFAGAGVWSYALRLAGFRDDWEVWTGSPPCQPFSVAGAGLGVDDARHLSPKFASLVRACRPPLLFGEQVASAQVFGPSAKGNRPGFEGTPPWTWIDDLCDRLEAAHYAVGANDVPNAGVGAPHIRQRTYFGAVRLADNSGEGLLSGSHSGIHRGQEGSGSRNAESERSGAACGLANNDKDGRESRHGIRSLCAEHDSEHGCGSFGLAHSIGEGLERHGRHGDDRGQSGRIGAIKTGSASPGGESLWMAHTHDAERGAEATGRNDGRGQDTGRTQGTSDTEGCGRADRMDDRGRPGPTNGFWRDADWLFCRDGQWRPVEPGLEPLANGTTARVGRLRLYGNAINPWPAKIYIEAFCEAAGIPLIPDGVGIAGVDCHI